MKLSSAFILAVASASEEKKVPPRHPLDRLNRLTQFTDEILDTWFTWLPSKDSWKAKFTNNAVRMRTNFLRGNQRCGFYNKEQLPHGGPEPENDRKRRDADFDVDRYNRAEPDKGIKQLTTGFRKWAERYIAECTGQRVRQHQIKRMNKWNDLLQAHLKANDQ